MTRGIKNLRCDVKIQRNRKWFWFRRERSCQPDLTFYPFVAFLGVGALDYRANVRLTLCKIQQDTHTHTHTHPSKKTKKEKSQQKDLSGYEGMKVTLQKSRTERVGNRRGEEDKGRSTAQSTAQYTTYTRLHGNYHTRTSDNAVPLLFLFWKLFNLYHMHCAACGRQSLQCSLFVADDMRNVPKKKKKRNTTG